MSEVELRWYMDDTDEEGRFMGTFDYWAVFNTEAALWSRLKNFRKKKEYWDEQEDRDQHGIDVLDNTIDSLDRAHKVFREMKVVMAREHHAKTSTVD